KELGVPAAASADVLKAQARLDRLTKLSAVGSGQTAVAYWGGTLRIVDAGGAVLTEQQLSQDVTALAWQGGRLGGGLGAGRGVSGDGEEIIGQPLPHRRPRHMMLSGIMGRGGVISGKAITMLALSVPRLRTFGRIAALVVGGVGLTLVLLIQRQPTAAEQAAVAEAPAEYECRWASGPITIDGKADEEAWKNAQVIDHFYLPWLGPKARKARTATKARLL